MMEVINLTLDLEEAILVKELLYDEIKRQQDLKNSDRRFIALDNTLGQRMQITQDLYNRMAHIGYGM